MRLCLSPFIFLIAAFCYSQGSPDIQWTAAGHRSAIRCAFSADGQRIFTFGAFDSTIKVWSANDGSYQQTIPLTQGADFDLSADESLVAVNGHHPDQRAHLYRASDGQLVRTFEPRLRFMRRPALSPDGQFIAAIGREGGQVRVWRVADGQVVSSFALGDNLMEIRFSPDGLHLGITKSDPSTSARTFYLYRTSDWSLVRQIVGSSDSQNHPGFEFSPDSQHIAWRGQGEGVGLWRLSDGAHLREFTSLPPIGFHNDVDFSSDGSLLCAFSGNHLAVWRVSDGLQIAYRSGHFRNVRFSPDASTLAIVISDEPAGRFDIVSRSSSYSNVVFKLSQFNYPRDYLSVSKDGLRIYSSGYFQGRVNITSAETGTATGDLTADTWIGVASQSLSPDGTQLLVGTNNENIRVFDLASGTLISTFPGRGVGLEIAAWMTTGKAFLSGGGHYVHGQGYEECKVYLRRAADGAIINTFGDHPENIRHVVAAPNGSLFLSASELQVLAWSPLTRRSMYALPGVRGAPVFSPDSALIAIPARAGNIHLFRSIDGAFVRLIECPVPVQCLSFSNDGTRLIAAGYRDVGLGPTASTLRIWRVADGAMLRSYDKDVNEIKSIAMDPDGQHFYYGRHDATLVKARLP